MMSRALSPAQGVADAHAAPARPVPATRPGRDPAPAAALHGVTKMYRLGRSTITALRDADLVFARGSCTAVLGASGSGQTTLRLAGTARAQVLRLAGTDAALVAALGTGLAAVVTAVTVAAVRRGLAGVAPAAGVMVPWTPLAAIALVCLVVAVLASVLTAAAALRDPGQTLAAAAPGPRAALGLTVPSLPRTARTTSHIDHVPADISRATCAPAGVLSVPGAPCAGKVGGTVPGGVRGSALAGPALLAP